MLGAQSTVRNLMGFTIEDMLLISQDTYNMELIAGKDGWSNSISWLLMVEDLTIIRRFDGKELAVTTGLGFESEEKLMTLLQSLSLHHASGLIINVGEYLPQVPQSAIDFCNSCDLPLLTVPWDIYIADMIKDLSIRIFFQGIADEQSSRAFILAIEHPDAYDDYRETLLPYYDLDGDFQIVLITTEGLDSMDTVERKRIGYRLELYLENISHNCEFFYYDSFFVLITNNVPQDVLESVLRRFETLFQRRMPDRQIAVGIGSRLKDIRNLHTAYSRAKAAAMAALHTGIQRICFDDMGIYRLLSQVQDHRLLEEMGDGLLQPILEHDALHHLNYFETLECFLQTGGSYQAMAEQMFIHRNTLMYRMNNIRKLLDSPLATAQDRLPYHLACLIHRMGSRDCTL